MENTVSLPKQNVKRTDRAWRTRFHCQNRMLKELTEHGEHGFIAKQNVKRTDRAWRTRFPLPKQNVKRTDRAWRTRFPCQNRMLKELTEHGEHGFLAKIEC